MHLLGRHETLFSEVGGSGCPMEGALARGGSGDDEGSPRGPTTPGPAQRALGPGRVAGTIRREPDLQRGGRGGQRQPGAEAGGGIRARFPLQAEQVRGQGSAGREGRSPRPSGSRRKPRRAGADRARGSPARRLLFLG